MKKLVKTLDATPAKRLYLSIIADYDVNKAICELVDNALDIWVKGNRRSSLDISISINSQQQTIQVCDNAGGIDRDDLQYVVAPGHSETSNSDETIGIFGVGTKRAVVALAQDISIRTRRASTTYYLEFDDDWIEKDENWRLAIASPQEQLGSIFPDSESRSAKIPFHCCVSI